MHILNFSVFTNISTLYLAPQYVRMTSSLHCYVLHTNKEYAGHFPSIFYAKTLNIEYFYIGPAGQYIVNKLYKQTHTCGSDRKCRQKVNKTHTNAWKTLRAQMILHAFACVLPTFWRRFSPFPQVYVRFYCPECFWNTWNTASCNFKKKLTNK